MNNLNKILEDCLEAIEHGATIEGVLRRYPEVADKLRPILETAVSAKNMAVRGPSADVTRRSRAKLLQHAAGLREDKARPKYGFLWFASFRRFAVALTVLTIVFASGTGLVRAASMTLPGDQLYPVKRTWENALVLITFNSRQREVLQAEQQNERLGELQELFKQGRSASVDFSGLVTEQNTGQLMVAGIPVKISAKTNLPGEDTPIGIEIRIIGQAQNGVVEAEEVYLISSDATPAPAVGDATSVGETQGTPVPPNGSATNSNPGLEATQTNSGVSISISSTPKPKSASFSGVIQSMNGNIWAINGVKVDVSKAQVSGNAVVGAVARVRGYFVDGSFFAKRIVISAPNSDVGNATSTTTTGNDGGGNGEGGGTDQATPYVTPAYHNDDHSYKHITETPEP